MNNLIKEKQKEIEEAYSQLTKGRQMEYRTYLDPKIPGTWILWEGEWVPFQGLYDKHIKPLVEERDRMTRFSKRVAHHPNAEIIDIPL